MTGDDDEEEEERKTERKDVGERWRIANDIEILLTSTCACIYYIVA